MFEAVAEPSRPLEFVLVRQPTADAGENGSKVRRRSAAEILAARLQGDVLEGQGVLGAEADGENRHTCCNCCFNSLLNGSYQRGG